MTETRRPRRVASTERPGHRTTTKADSTPRLVPAASTEAQGVLFKFPDPDGWERLGDVTGRILRQLIRARKRSA
jgi:hypothetical protein